MKKLNIGILSDSPFIPTGYRNQATSLADILVERGHNIFYFAHAYQGQSLLPGTKLEDGRVLNYTVVGQAREPYFKDVIEQYTKLYKIDVLIILQDLFMYYPWILQLDFAPAKTIFWFPSDGGGGLPLGCESIFKKIDIPIAMAKFGKEQVKKCHNVDVEYIPHAINPNQFYQLSNEEKLKLKKQWGLDGKFVIGVVARNQGRKMLDRTIKIMAEYAKLNPNAILLLHLDPDDVAQPFPIMSLITRYGIQNRVLFTGTKWFRGYNDSQMNSIYNLFDVFLLSTSGEGFGIPIIEAMSCQVPVLATNYTTTKELVIDTKSGYGINLSGVEEVENPSVHGYEILDGTITGSWSVERGLCSIKDAVKKLDELYKNPELRNKMGENGRKAILSEYIWEITKNKWISIVENLGEQY